MMKLTVFIIAMFTSTMAFGQWEVVYTFQENGNDKDLFFVNRDTGFVIGIQDNVSYIKRTLDGGDSWEVTEFPEHYMGTSTVFFPSADTGYVSAFRNNYAGVLRTVDGGDNWEQIADSLVQATSIPYPISFFNNDSGIISLPGWIARTFDAGENWQVLISEDSGGTRDNDIDDGFYAGCDGILNFWSNDYGNSFDLDTIHNSGSHYQMDLRRNKLAATAIGQQGVSLGFPNNSFGVVSIGVLGEDNYEVQSFPSLSRVHDVHWLNDTSIAAIFRYASGFGDPELFFMRSDDMGITWYTQEANSNGYTGTRFLYCVDDSVCYAVGGTGEVYKTTNGGGELGQVVNYINLSSNWVQKPVAIKVYPNPSSGEIIIEGEKRIDQISLFDSRGLEIKDFKRTGNKLQLVGLAPGIYTLVVEGRDYVVTKKIMLD